MELCIRQPHQDQISNHTYQLINTVTHQTLEIKTAVEKSYASHQHTLVHLWRKHLSSQ